MSLESYAQRFSYIFKPKLKFWSSCFFIGHHPLVTSAETVVKISSKTCDNATMKNTHGRTSECYERKNIKLRKKYAILFSYSGKNYYGLQRNPDVLTVEEELLSAMRKAEVISQDNYEDPYKLDFQRASRTDKGVSALRQVVSLFLPTEVDSTTVKKINKYLPSQIQVMGIQRVTRAFDAKESCDSRLYSYMLPTFAFCPLDMLCTEAYRLPRNGVDQINSVLKEYEGTHNFHNFTNHRSFEERSCHRHILFCECGQPFTVRGLEFVVIRIKGHSFMLHQIRRMVALAIAIVRGLANVNNLIKAYGEEKLDIPMVPGLGLMLEEIFYDSYNTWKCGDGKFEPIAWEQFQDEVYCFREKYIRSDIVDTEIKEKSMMKWLQESFCHTYDVMIKDKEMLHSTPRQFHAAIRLAKVQQQERDMLSTNVNLCSDVSKLSMCNNFAVSGE